MKFYRINCYLYSKCMWLVFMVVFLVACDLGQITPTPTPQPEEPTITPTTTSTVTATSTTTVTPTDPPTVTPTTTPTMTPTVTPIITETVPTTPIAYRTFYPSDEEIQQIRGGIEQNPPNEEETGHILPSPEQLGMLTELCLRESDRLGLQNPECDFNEEWTTSYTLIDIGLIYQLLSLKEGGIIDEQLQQLENWESGLVLGGIWVHQDAIFAEFDLFPGPYLVILMNNLEFELYNVNGEPAASGSWQLRQLNGEAAAAVALVTPDQVCFSGLVMQACLNTQSPGMWSENPNVEAVQAAVSNLQDSGWLPEDVVVNFDHALASIEGVDKVEACYSDVIEQSEFLENCFPNLVVAAIEPLSDTVGLAKTAFLAKIASPPLQVTGLISEAVIGIGVMEVLEPLSGEVFNLNGEIADLEIGSYRVDFLGLTDGSYLLQFISADDTPYYLDAVPAAGEGEPVEGDEPNEGQDDTLSEVLLDAILWKVCRPNGWGDFCDSVFTKKWQYWCASWAQVGWCHANGVFLPG